MIEFLASLPWQGWVALLTLAGGALWKPAETMVKWLRASGESEADREEKFTDQLIDRCHSLEQLIEAHRRALDKGRVRENAVLTSAEVMLGIIELIPEPSPAQQRMRLRAIEILELAKRQNGGIQ